MVLFWNFHSRVEKSVGVVLDLFECDKGCITFELCDLGQINLKSLSLSVFICLIKKRLFIENTLSAS